MILCQGVVCMRKVTNIYIPACIIILLIDSFIEAKTHERHLVIVTPSRNNAMWYQRNATAILTQHYDNYTWIYIDDASTDGTPDLIMNRIKYYDKEDRCIVVRNKKRQGALANIYHAIHTYTLADDIVLLYDGDDWLEHDRVLQIINEAYEDPHVWLTYGQMKEYPHGGSTYCQELPAEVIANQGYRTHKWVTSHLRTFYAWLFKQIKKEDLLDEAENFWPMTWDQAIMFPLLEMAHGRWKFIQEVLYVYNGLTPFNDCKKDPHLQKKCEWQIRKKKKYQPLEARPIIK
jgi:glycosyltransferase involved in cell wall biosynthesis